MHEKSLALSAFLLTHLRQWKLVGLRHVEVCHVVEEHSPAKVEGVLLISQREQKWPNSSEVFAQFLKLFSPKFAEQTCGQK